MVRAISGQAVILEAVLGARAGTWLERQIVALEVEGSNPSTHPKSPTLNRYPEDHRTARARSEPKEHIVGQAQNPNVRPRRNSQPG